MAVAYGVVFAIIGGCFMLLNVIGSWVIAAVAKSRAHRPKSAATMIAMRRILDNPKRAWRNVSGIALAVFIAASPPYAAHWARHRATPTRRR